MKKGTTLIEVLVASLLLVISIGTMLMSFVHSERIVYHNNFKNEAYAIIQSNLEYYLNKGGINIENDIDNQGYTTTGYFEAASYGKIPYTLNIKGKRRADNLPLNVKGFQAKYLEVTATVKWNDVNGEQKISMSTYYPYSDLTTVTGNWSGGE